MGRFLPLPQYKVEIAGLFCSSRLLGPAPKIQHCAGGRGCSKTVVKCLAELRATSQPLLALPRINSSYSLPSGFQDKILRVVRPPIHDRCVSLSCNSPTILLRCSGIACRPECEETALEKWSSTQHEQQHAAVAKTGCTHGAEECQGLVIVMVSVSGPPTIDCDIKVKTSAENNCRHQGEGPRGLPPSLQLGQLSGPRTHGLASPPSVPNVNTSHSLSKNR